MSSSKKALLLILIFWTGSVIVIFGFIALHQMRKQSVENERDDRIGQMAGEIQKGEESFLVDPDALPVSGEEDEAFGYANGNIGAVGNTSDAGSSSAANDAETGIPEGYSCGNISNANSSSGSEYILTSYGTIEIPSIGLELPVWDGAGVIELRYGAGRMPLSCEAGSPGNLVIFGHRMRRYGSIFNRLGEVSIGDAITVTRNGSSFSYIVDQIVTIEPSEISYYISREDEGDACVITLITCTPVGVGTQRLLVIGHLQGS
ncbi:MAG: class D sortase [Clostridiales bacterium]|nr:class D sortase [Clostridiales bacterium]